MPTQRVYQVAECSYCHRVRAIAAHGWCRACYQRWRKNGVLEKIKVRHQCKVDGCERYVQWNGFCEFHGDRVRSTGDPHQTLRPQDWGDRHKHPLYFVWREACKQTGVVEQWNDFWVFVHDVGPSRPDGRCRLQRKREDEALGPKNFRWGTALVSGKAGAAYAREHRKLNPDYWKNSDLKKNFGITLDQYKAMHEKQGGRCAICGDTNSEKDKRTGIPRRLAVDHCHATQKIRGLLCSRCNQGLGNFRDNPVFLAAALKYLKGHA